LEILVEPLKVSVERTVQSQKDTQQLEKQQNSGEGKKYANKCKGTLKNETPEANRYEYYPHKTVAHLISSFHLT
jgi:hypothetical protein